MAAWVCTGCTTTYAVGAPCCPHCGSAEHVEQGEDMPKITRFGGPSIAGVTGGWSDNDTPDTWPAQESTEPDAEEAPAVVEGGEQSSPGNSSSTSGEKQSSEPDKKPSSRRKPARTTASPSTRARTANSSAPGMAGGQEDGTSATGSAPEGAEAE